MHINSHFLNLLPGNRNYLFTIDYNFRLDFKLLFRVQWTICIID
jgi:hypothetical protein